MALVDRTTQKVVVRIVYDGPARAGKSTNLRGLCRTLTPLRRSDLFVPGELSGRTLFFDWLQLEAGVVGGRPLQCQFVTVPGQNVFHRRRRLLLETADAVVFVCDSTPPGVRHGRETLQSLRSFLATRDSADTPIVVQANKQDLPEALPVREVLSELELPPDVPAMGAAAEQGTGIRETAVLAIRAAASRVQSSLLSHGAEPLLGSPETAEELHETMLELERRLPLSPSEALRTFPGARGPRPATTAARHDGPDSAEFETEPAFPFHRVSSDAVWPTPEGRAVLRAVAGETLERRNDLTGQPGPRDGSGKSDTILFRAGPWCLKTSARRFYESSAEARRALLSLVRTKLSLGSFLVPRTVLCLSPDGGRGRWLWTVTPWLETLRSEMAGADASADEARLGRALEAFARTAVSALALSARSGSALDVHPSNLARSEGRIVYLDDDVGAGAAIPSIGYSLLQRVEEYSHRPGAILRYLQAIEAAIPGELSREEAARLGLESDIEQAVVRSEEARQAQRRLTRLFRRPVFAVEEP